MKFKIWKLNASLGLYRCWILRENRLNVKKKYWWTNNWPLKNTTKKFTNTINKEIKIPTWAIEQSFALFRHPLQSFTIVRNYKPSFAIFRISSPSFTLFSPLLQSFAIISFDLFRSILLCFDLFRHLWPSFTYSRPH